MGIDLRWENESGQKLDEISDPKGCLGLALGSFSLNDTICLRFIDPYGNTVFNQQQIHVLIKELRWLSQFITPEKIAALQEKTFRVHQFRAGQAGNRVRRKKLSPEEVRGHLQKMIELAQRSDGELHTYLKLYGD